MTRIRLLSAAMLASVLAACSGGSGVTTASLLGTPAAQPQTDGPTERAVHSASVAARASKCGYNFNPTKLRESFLAAEAANGATPEQMTKLGQSYDFTHTTVSKQISSPEEYCSEQRTRQVSTDLQKQLAGDFRAPKKPPLPASAGWWDTASSQKAMDREEIFNPKHSR